MATPLPDLSLLCIAFQESPGELCVEFPGGAKLCAQFGYEMGDPFEIVKSMLAQINSALVPLQPFFDMLDLLKKIVDCVQAIPDCLGPPPDPTPLLSCIPGLIEAINKLLQLIPPIPILKLAKHIIGVIVMGLIGLRQKIVAMLRQLDRILAAATKAAELGNIQLQVIADCASGNMDIQLQNLNAGLLPLNRLIGVVNALLKLVGADCIPTLAGLTDLSDELLAPLDAVIALLQALQAAIPVIDLSLEAIPLPGDPC